MDDVAQIVDHASKQGDRWMFVACLAMLVIAVVFAARWHLADRARILREYREINERYHEELKLINAQQLETIKSLSACLNKNTSALNRCSFELRYARKHKQHHHTQHITKEEDYEGNEMV